MLKFILCAHQGFTLGGFTLHPLIADLLLLLVALVWGLTFPAIKGALEGIGPYAFLAIRFSLASIFLIIVYLRKIRTINKYCLQAGFFIGFVLFGAYALQTIGIQYTTASNAAFISGLTVVLVPLLNIPFSKQLPNFYALLGAISATFGLGLLSLNSSFSINFGDFLVLLCAFCFALQIILVGRFAPNTDSELLTIIQITIVAFFSGLFTLNLETLPEKFTSEVWLGLAITAIPATSLAYLIQNKVQQFTSPARTAIAFSMEPVFGAIFSYFWLQETLTTQGLIGCGFVLLGMLIAELKS